ncbi:MAG: hypothetical protein KAJ62_07370 [Desulfobacteraceae bacterium]|nr:hypothetical protein [Desulfobacteraceae bacterium]
MFYHSQNVFIKVTLALFLTSFFGCSTHNNNSNNKANTYKENSKIYTSKTILELDNSNRNTRFRALKKIAKAGTNASITLDKVIYIAENDSNKNVRKYALKTIGMIHPDKLEAMEYLRAYSKNSKKSEMKKVADEAYEDTICLFFSDGIAIKNDDNIEIANLVVVPEFEYYNGWYKNRRAISYYGFLPIKMRLTNLSSSKISFHAQDFILSTPDRPNDPLKNLSGQEVATRMQYSISKSVAKVAVFGILALKNPQKVAKANKSITTYSNKVAINKIEIKPNSMKTGYIFVDVSKNMHSIYNYNLSIKLRDMANTDIYDVKCVFGDKYQVSYTQGDSPIKQVETDIDIKTKLMNLRALRDEGLITNEEYIKTKKSLIKAY